jgi:hypothetical protein
MFDVMKRLRSEERGDSMVFIDFVAHTDSYFRISDILRWSSASERVLRVLCGETEELLTRNNIPACTCKGHLLSLSSI